MHLPFIVDSCTLNLSNKMCTRLKHLLRFIIVLYRVQEDGAAGGSTPKDGLPDQEGF